jgi:FkbM family methyltransferase
MKIKKIFNQLIGFTGYQIKNRKYLYESDKNLIKSINYFNINTILDIGANKGQFALNLLENNFKGKILSFEPLSYEHKLLKKFSKNKKNWFIEKKCALGQKKFKKTLFITGNRESSSLLKILPTHIEIKPDSKIIKSEIVNVEKLNSFKNKIKKLKKNLLLKIDTQGSEIDVLLGADEVIKDIKCLFIEVSLIPLYEKQKLWMEVIKYLKNLGFNIWSIDPLLRNKSTGQTYQVDMFFHRKNA